MPLGHDGKISEIAKKLDDEGWNVKAEVEGFEDPPSLGRRMPDIYASRRGTTLIYEIENREDLPKDKEQLCALRRYAGRRFKTRFILEIVG